VNNAKEINLIKEIKQAMKNGILYSCKTTIRRRGSSLTLRMTKKRYHFRPQKSIANQTTSLMRSLLRRDDAKEMREKTLYFSA
jgi:hypothetical protein